MEVRATPNIIRMVLKKSHVTLKFDGCPMALLDQTEFHGVQIHYAILGQTVT